MPVPQNLIVHITLPKGLALTTGAFLDNDVTFDVIGQLAPFYGSVDMVRLNGGSFLRKLSDITIASEIYDVSKQADLISPDLPPTNVTSGFSPTSQQYRIFAGSRQQWVVNKATQSLLLDLSTILGPATHTLANFSVSRDKGYPNEGLSGMLTVMERTVAIYEVGVRSGGRTQPGGRARPRMAAKGVFDWAEVTPSRGWAVNGMGANAKSLDWGSPSGGRGKPVNFFANPVFSPPLYSFRSGTYTGGYALQVIRPFTQYTL